MYEAAIFFCTPLYISTWESDKLLNFFLNGAANKSLRKYIENFSVDGLPRFWHSLCLKTTGACNVPIRLWEFKYTVNALDFDYGSEDTNITKLLIPHLFKKSSAIYPLSKRQYMKNKGSDLKLAIANEFCIFFFLRTNKTTIICWFKIFLHWFCSIFNGAWFQLRVHIEGWKMFKTKEKKQRGIRQPNFALLIFSVGRSSEVHIRILLVCS